MKTSLHALVIPLLLTADRRRCCSGPSGAGITGHEGERLAALALERVPESGASNPVTSVLLNYRAYDTLIELAVLLAALLGIWSLGPAAAPYQPASMVLVQPGRAGWCRC
jgi:hypothetical protein